MTEQEPPNGRGGGILGLLLAGGASRRMGGGDKCLRELGGRTLLAHVIARVAPQVDRLLLSANGDPARFAAYGLTVIPDMKRTDEENHGPLAGIAAGLDWAGRQDPPWPLIATFPTDTPFLPRDLVSRLAAARRATGRPLACAALQRDDTTIRTQPVVGLWPVDLAGDLQRALADGVRKVDAWTARHGVTEVLFGPGRDSESGNPFFNVNFDRDLTNAEQIITARGGSK